MFFRLRRTNYGLKVHTSAGFVEKILVRLSKERAKRKSAEDQTTDSLFLRDTFFVPKPVVSDPGLPKNTESVHPVSIKTSLKESLPAPVPVPLENVSLPVKESLPAPVPLENVSLPVPAEGLSKEKEGPSSLKANGNGEKANGKKADGNGEIIRKAEDLARKESVSTVVRR